MATQTTQLPDTPSNHSERVEKLLLSLTRDIAQDILPLEEILKLNGVTASRFALIQNLPRYRSMLHQARLEWATAKNSAERVRLKTAIMIEDALPELHSRLHDRTELLASKVRLAEFLGKLSGITEKANASGPAAETFKVVINLGEDRKLEIEKSLPTKVIEHEPRDEDD
jgi:hypothetical protein